jgi:sensor histidine kinase regulating citrate/malate metabolism
MLLITMKNSSDGVYRTNKHGQLLTRKQIDISAFEHGIGLNRVQELAERHNGFMNIQPEQEQFTVFIMIPLTD